MLTPDGPKLSYTLGLARLPTRMVLASNVYSHPKAWTVLTFCASALASAKLNMFPVQHREHVLTQSLHLPS